MSAAVAVLAAALLPTPYDLIHADTLLHQLPDTPAGVGSPPLVRAVLVRMLALDAVDPGCLYQWFGPHPFQSELDHARRLVARVATCPPLSADTLPPGSWFAAEAERCRQSAAGLRCRAAEYREAAVWEDWRGDRLEAAARRLEGEAGRLYDAAVRYDGWAGRSWQRPRRVVMDEAFREGWR